MTAVGYTGGDPSKVDVAGDTMTGLLILSGDPVVPLGAATKQFAEAQGGGGGGSGTPSNTVVTETTYAQASTAGVAIAYSRGDHTHGTMITPTKTTVGLGSVDNTSDVSKPVSTAQATANGVVATNAANALAAHEADTTNIHGIVNTANLVLTNDARLSDARTPTVHAASHGSGGSDPITIAESQVTNLVTDLAAKQPLDTDLTMIAGLTATTDNVIQSVASAWASRTPAQLKTTLALVKGDVGLGNVDNTSDVSKPVSTAQQTALNLKADLASPTFTGTPSLPTGSTGVTQTAGNNTTALATTAFVTTADNLKADLTSPTFTGTPAAPTAAGATNTTQLATTAFVQTAAGLLVPKSTVTTKGDLIIATASATVTRRGVGVNGTILRANSANGDGWETTTNYQTQLFAFTGAATVQAGVLRWYNRTGRTLNVVGCWAAANTQPTGAALVADVNKNGTTIFTTQGNRPSVTAATNGGVLSATPDVTTVADGDYVTVDIDVIGSTIAGSDVTVGVVYW